MTHIVTSDLPGPHVTITGDGEREAGAGRRPDLCQAVRRAEMGLWVGPTG
jgi:hypothetical protein